jgi:hypothetical protein
LTRSNSGVIQPPSDCSIPVSTKASASASRPAWPKPSARSLRPVKSRKPNDILEANDILSMISGHVVRQPLFEMAPCTDPVTKKMFGHSHYALAEQPIGLV